MFDLMLLKQNWHTYIDAKGVSGLAEGSVSWARKGWLAHTWYPQGHGLKLRSERSNSSMQRGLKGMR